MFEMFIPFPRTWSTEPGPEPKTTGITKAAHPTLAITPNTVLASNVLSPVSISQSWELGLFGTISMISR